MGNTALVDEVVAAGAPGRAALLPARPALPVHHRVHRRRPGRGRRRPTAGSSPSSAGRPSGWAPTPATACSAPSSPTPWTTTSAPPPRSPRSTRRSARATPPSPTATTPPSPGPSARCGPCSASSASTRSTRAGPTGGSDEQLDPGDRRARLARARAAPGRPRPQGLRSCRRDPRSAHRPRRHRRGHPAGTTMGADPLMAGNSQRRGRTTGAGKKTATAGTGGKNRRSLAGRGRDPAGRGAARPPGPAQGRRRGQRRAPTAPAPASAPRRRPELLLGRNPVVEALRAKIPATALYVVTGDNRRAADERITEARAAGRRPRAAAARGGQGRVRPDVAGRAAPGHRPAGPAVRLRAPRRPARHRPRTRAARR